MNIKEKKNPQRAVIGGARKFTDFSRKEYQTKVNRFKRYLNQVIRKKIVEQLGKKLLLKGKKIVIRVDDHCVYLLGELDSWEQRLEVRQVLMHLETGRKVLNQLTIRPNRGIYKFQKNLL